MLEQAADRDALSAGVADATFDTGGPDAGEVVKYLLRALAAAGVDT